jgi:ADP-ribose pyrophosphatase
MDGREVGVLEATVAYDGHFKIVRYRLRHRRFDGGWSPPLTREIFERGHAAAVLPYDPARDLVVLIEQFRAGALEDERGAWLLEPVAGVIDPGDAPEPTVRREAVEEAGLELRRLAFVCDYLVSPGGTSERVSLYIGEADAAGAGGVHGLADEAEDIKVHVVAFDEAMRWLDDGWVRVASAVIALQWLALHRDELRTAWRGAAPAPRS